MNLCVCHYINWKYYACDLRNVNLIMLLFGYVLYLVCGEFFKKGISANEFYLNDTENFETYLKIFNVRTCGCSLVNNLEFSIVPFENGVDNISLIYSGERAQNQCVSEFFLEESWNNSGDGVDSSHSCFTNNVEGIINLCWAMKFDCSISTRATICSRGQLQSDTDPFSFYSVNLLLCIDNELLHELTAGREDRCLSQVQHLRKFMYKQNLNVTAGENCYFSRLLINFLDGLSSSRLSCCIYYFLFVYVFGSETKVNRK